LTWFLIYLNTKEKSIKYIKSRAEAISPGMPGKYAPNPGGEEAGSWSRKGTEAEYKHQSDANSANCKYIRQQSLHSSNSPRRQTENVLQIKL